MRDQAAQHVVRVLPDRLGDDDGRLGIEAGKDVHSLALRGEKAVLLLLAIMVGADDRITLGLDGAGQGFFHLFLGRPAFLIGGEPQIAAGDEVDLFFAKPLRLGRFAVI